jgi:hypothetical protein
MMVYSFITSEVSDGIQIYRYGKEVRSRKADGGVEAGRICLPEGQTCGRFDAIRGLI